ncbi:hypothetical protein LTS08_000089 [Lithohypha guttulata]|nr:hypothetical protein LTS08_000089 [Lithohypha guttulata]
MGSIGPAPSSSTPHVAFLGLGAMGFAMSTHLVRTGIQVTGFDIFQPTLDRWQQACTKIQQSENPKAKFSTTTSGSEAVKSGANIVILMVATHHHVNSALFDSGAVRDLPQDVPVIIMATVPPTHPGEVRQRLTEEFGRPDIKLIDAPVSGGVARSQNGTLTIMASSNDSENMQHPLVSTCLKTLSNNGATLYPIPGSLGAGTSAKALNQVQCGIHIVGASEIMVLAALTGLNTTQFSQTVATDVMDSSTGKERHPYGWTWMFTNRAPRMLDPALPIASAISIINKDVGIIYDEEARLKTELPLLNAAHSQLRICMDSGIAGWDDAFITKYYLDPSLKNEQKQQLVVEHAQEGYTADADADTEQIVLQAHCLINLISAYETVKFAEALDLMGPRQRAMWSELIAGAAGGSTVFSEVIQHVFEASNWHDGFKIYAQNQVGAGKAWDIEKVEGLLKKAKQANPDFEPKLVEQAIKLIREVLL